jgi:hypothetical protein
VPLVKHGGDRHGGIQGKSVELKRLLTTRLD